MSRREGSGQTHHPPTVSEGNNRDRRPPSAQYSRYSEHPVQPPPLHARSDLAPHYQTYHPPPPARLSYPPDPPRPDPRHLAHQRHAPLRGSEHASMYSRPEYYPVEAVIPPVHQPAPRQRTAVACRYCRRRKVFNSFITTNARSDVPDIKARQTDAVRTVSSVIKSASSCRFQQHLMIHLVRKLRLI